SVLAVMNSTPLTFSSIIRFTAFPPPPPTPMTLITAPSLILLSIENSISYSSQDELIKNICKETLDFIFYIFSGLFWFRLIVDCFFRCFIALICVCCFLFYYHLTSCCGFTSNSIFCTLLYFTLFF